MHLRQVRLTLEEAILGCTRTLSGHYSHCCDVCAGKGQRVLAKACGDCRGSGAVRRPALVGWLWYEEACAGCGGDGRQRAPCDACVGRGEQVQAYRRRVRFPPGLRGGHVLTVPAAQPGEWGLELELEIEPHALFSLDDEGVLHCEMPVNGYAWMAGRWVDVPTPTGLQQMRLNREALVYRMRGQGFPETLRGPRGDYLVKVVPEFPAKADAAQEALLDELIASTSQAAEADAGQPLGQWQRRLKRWSGSRKEQPH
jgi:molecular chaperone DnaJ